LVCKDESKHSMCGPHQDSDIICGSVRYFGWHSCSPPFHHKLSVALFFTHVTFTCIESTFRYPHKQFLIPRPPPQSSAGSRTLPANAGTRNPRRTLPATQKIQYRMTRVLVELL